MNVKRSNPKFCVYCHINKINGKRYIGQTCDLKERWRCKGKNYFASVKFFNAIKKYGWDSFEHIVLYENLTLEEANRIEEELIEKYDTIKNGYNIKSGGENSVMSEESKKKMSETLKKGYVEHPERKEKISKARKGWRMSEEHRKKISEANKGRPHISHQIDIWFNGIKYNKQTFSKLLNYKNDSKISSFIKRFGFDYFQSFINDYNNVINLRNDLEFIIPSTNSHKVVLQLNPDGTLVKEWSSAVKVQIETKKIWIYKYIKDGTDGEYLWRYKN